MKHLLTIVLAAVLLLTSTSLVSAKVVIPTVPSERGSEAEYQRSQRDGLDAQKHMKRKRWKKMLFRAESAWATYKSATYALLQGIALARLKRSEEAFRWLLTAKAMKPASSIIQAADKELAALSEELQLGVWGFAAPKGATVLIDGVRATGRVVGLSYGEHKVVISQEGYETRKTVVDITGPTAPETLFSLKKSKPKVAPPKVEGPPNPPVPEASSDSSSIALPLGLIVGGVVLAGAGAGLHVWGAGAHDEANALNGQWSGVTYEEGEERFNALRSDGDAGTISGVTMYAIGGALIIAGAVVWALQGDSEGEGTADVVFAPTLQRGGIGAALSGSF